ncbi:hypothetical protein RUM43_009759 [Polyplax serrata]|uniref:Uncharacterized protein n=1 Tax=Polyplax serrata TaxID=468196 RepID=A0AAN8PJQ5_POLSC
MVNYSCRKRFWERKVDNNKKEEKRSRLVCKMIFENRRSCTYQQNTQTKIDNENAGATYLRIIRRSQEGEEEPEMDGRKPLQDKKDKTPLTRRPPAKSHKTEKKDRRRVASLLNCPPEPFIKEGFLSLIMQSIKQYFDDKNVKLDKAYIAADDLKT